MKKKILVLFFIMIILSGCSKKINMNNVSNEPNFMGTVKEINEYSILVTVNENEDEFQSSDLISVSLDAKLKDSTGSFNIEDEVRVYYDGNIAESYPAQINNVYLIDLIKLSNKDNITKRFSSVGFNSYGYDRRAALFGYRI